MSTDEVYIYIIDFNNSLDTVNAINSILSSHLIKTRIFLHINGSSNEHSRRLYEQFKSNNQVILTSTEKNIGFTGAVNLLFEKSKADYPLVDYILLFNNDAIVEPESINKLLTVIKSRPDIGVVGPRVLELDKKDVIQTDGANLLKYFMQQSFANVGKSVTDCPPGSPYSVSFVSGACMLIRADLLDKTNGFDDRYFAYFEDLDFCIKIEQYGFGCLHVPESRVFHKGSGTSGKDSSLYHFLMTRNRFMIARKYLSMPVFICIFLPYFLLSRIVYKSFILLINNKIDGIKGIYNALRWLSASGKNKIKFWPVI